MNRMKWFAWRIAWLMMAITTLSGCQALKGFGRGLTDVFKGFQFR